MTFTVSHISWII